MAVSADRALFICVCVCAMRSATIVCVQFCLYYVCFVCIVCVQCVQLQSIHPVLSYADHCLHPVLLHMRLFFNTQIITLNLCTHTCASIHLSLQPVSSNFSTCPYADHAYNLSSCAYYPILSIEISLPTF